MSEPTVQQQLDADDITSSSSSPPPQQPTSTISEMLTNALSLAPHSKSGDGTIGADDANDDTFLQHRQEELEQQSLFLFGLCDQLQKEYSQNGGDLTKAYNDTLGENEEFQTQKSKQLNKIPVAEQQKAEELFKLLQSDAKNLLSFALDIKQFVKDKKAAKTTTEKDVVQDPDVAKMNEKLAEMKKFANNVEGRYQKYSQHVLLRSSKIINATIKSEDATRFLNIGQSILKKWVDKKSVILEQAAPKTINTTRTLEDGTVVEEEVPAEQYISTSLDAVDNNLSQLLGERSGDVLDFVSSIRVDAVLFLNGLDRHKQTVLTAANDIKNVIEEEDESGGKLKDDEDVKALLALGKKGGASLQKIVNSSTNEENIDNTSKKIHRDTDKVFDYIEENEIGKNLLVRGAELLEKHQNDLDPENFLNRMNDLKESKAKRQKFITDVKNELLTFLLEYLPHIKIKPLIHDDANQHYELRKIDLSNFECLAQNVEVLLLEERKSVLLTAHSINCTMNDLEFMYKSKSFPYPSANGKAQCVAKNISIMLELKLEEVPIEEEEEEEVKKSGEEQEEVVAPIDSLDEEDEEEEKQPQVEHKSTEQQTNPEQQQQEQQQQEQKIEDVSTADGETPKKKSHAQKILNTINEKLTETAQYRLVMTHHPELGVVKIGELDLELTDFWLKSLANILLNLFRDSIREYITKTINNVILKESSHLLTKINAAVKTYLPILARVLQKIEGKSAKIEEIVVTTAKKIQKDVLDDKKKFKEQQKMDEEGVTSGAEDGLIPAVRVEKIKTAQPQLAVPQAKDVLDLKKKPLANDTNDALHEEKEEKLGAK